MSSSTDKIYSEGKASRRFVFLLLRKLVIKYWQKAEMHSLLMAGLQTSIAIERYVVMMYLYECTMYVGIHNILEHIE